MSPSPSTNRYAPLLILAVLVLLPFGRLSALPMLVLLIAGLGLIWRHRHWVITAPAPRLFIGLFACYWLPIAASAVDAVNPERTLTTLVASLRYLPVGLYVLAASHHPQTRRWVLRGSAWVVLIWALDAAVQQVLGYNLLGMPLAEDRLNGIFGATNLKLGPVLAVLSPLALEYLRREARFGVWLVGLGLLAAVILLVGTRAAWVMFGVVVACMLYLHARQAPGRAAVALAALLATASVAGLAGYHLVPGWQARVDRSMLALEGNDEALDAALSKRLPIWRTAGEIVLAHPVNGVGARGFRYAYPNYAEPDDPWVSPDRPTGAAHAHQVLLEILTGTGLIGLLGFALAVALAVRAWLRASVGGRRAALPYAIALGAMLFPVNTHLAFYSTFWSLLCWWLVALYCGHLEHE